MCYIGLEEDLREYKKFLPISNCYYISSSLIRIEKFSQNPIPTLLLSFPVIPAPMNKPYSQYRIPHF